MEAKIFLTTVALLVLGGASIIDGCDMAGVNKCNEMSPKSKEAKELCDNAKAKIQCLEDILVASPDCKATVDPTLKHTKALQDQLCNSDGKCSMTKVATCGIMDLETKIDQTDKSKLCGLKDDITKAVTCVEGMLPHCDEAVAKTLKETNVKFTAMIAKCDNSAEGPESGAVGLQVSTTILSTLAVPVLVQVFGRL